MAKWYDANGQYHDTDNLEYGNQGDTSYWAGKPGEVGSTSYDAPNYNDTSNQLYTVTDPNKPSITWDQPRTGSEGFDWNNYQALYQQIYGKPYVAPTSVSTSNPIYGGNSVANPINSNPTERNPIQALQNGFGQGVNDLFNSSVKSGFKDPKNMIYQDPQTAMINALGNKGTKQFNFGSGSVQADWLESIAPQLYERYRMMEALQGLDPYNNQLVDRRRGWLQSGERGAMTQDEMVKLSQDEGSAYGKNLQTQSGALNSVLAASMFGMDPQQMRMLKNMLESRATNAIANEEDPSNWMQYYANSGIRA